MKKSPMTLLALLACILLFGGLITYLPASSAVVEEAAPPMEKYINEEKGYSIEYPKDWQKQEIPRLDIVLLSPTRNAESQTHANMNLVSEAVGEKVTLDQFYDESVKHLTAELVDVKVEKTGDLNIHGIPSKWIQYKHRMIDNNFGVLQYFMVAEGNIYLITFSGVTEDFEHFLTAFEKIAASFKELPKAAKN
ncbi:MAG: hypothetical protein H0X29_05095 [Parachlamydiaceae bacterium]|nr:hypothetical protein [Parachlamydiaceae bacterium]